MFPIQQCLTTFSGPKCYLVSDFVLLFLIGLIFLAVGRPYVKMTGQAPQLNVRLSLFPTPGKSHCHEMASSRIGDCRRRKPSSWFNGLALIWYCCDSHLRAQHNQEERHQPPPPPFKKVYWIEYMTLTEGVKLCGSPRQDLGVRVGSPQWCAYTCTTPRRNCAPYH